MYQGLVFPNLSSRTFFYTNFVTTLDGKAIVTNQEDYWPIGSKKDYQVFIELRTYADCLIHGKNTATSHHTLKSLEKPEFQNQRKKVGKEPNLTYVIVSNHPNLSLIPYLQHSKKIKVYLYTSRSAYLDKNLSDWVEVVRLGDQEVDIANLALDLYQRGLKVALVEGGPNLMGQFFKVGIMDEIFLTMAPKIYGNINNGSKTMVEDYLLPKERIKNYQLLSIKKRADEVFLRYRDRELNKTDLLK